jgi:small subunit ribosomal protein S6
MTNTYELVLILDPTIEESQVADKFARLEELLKSQQAVIVNVLEWGKRKLAYQIKKKDNGIYRVYRFEAQPSVIAEIERRLKIDEQVMRFLVVLYDPAVEKKAEKPAGAEDDDA